MPHLLNAVREGYESAGRAQGWRDSGLGPGVRARGSQRPLVRRRGPRGCSDRAGRSWQAPVTRPHRPAPRTQPRRTDRRHRPRDRRSDGLRIARATDRVGSPDRPGDPGDDHDHSNSRADIVSTGADVDASGPGSGRHRSGPTAAVGHPTRRHRPGPTGRGRCAAPPLRRGAQPHGRRSGRHDGHDECRVGGMERGRDPASLLASDVRDDIVDRFRTRVRRPTTPTSTTCPTSTTRWRSRPARTDRSASRGADGPPASGPTSPAATWSTTPWPTPTGPAALSRKDSPACPGADVPRRHRPEPARSRLARPLCERTRGITVTGPARTSLTRTECSAVRLRRRSHRSGGSSPHSSSPSSRPRPPGWG